MHSFMERYTPEQIADLDRRTKEIKEASAVWLTEKMAELGFQEVDDISGLELSPEEKKKMNWTRWYDDKKEHADIKRLQGGNPRMFIGRREDGTQVKISVKALGKTRMLFAADIFSSAFYEGHSGNHDFSDHELQQNIKFALTGSKYQK